MSGPFERFIGIDWSGASKASGQQIFVAEARRKEEGVRLLRVVRAKDRSAVKAFLRGDPIDPAPEWEDWPRPDPPTGSKRTLVGLDFAFGFPAEFEHPSRGERWTWGDLARLCGELDSAANLRRAIDADEVLRRQFALGDGPSPTRRYRETEKGLSSRAESVFHLIGPSQVGAGSIRGIAMLDRLRDSALAVWPFDGDETTTSPTVLVEVFPRLWLRKKLNKAELPARATQLEEWKRDAVAAEGHAELAALASGDAIDAAAAAIGLARDNPFLPMPGTLPDEARRREGWIVGVPAPS
jgi:hypothetical protein